MVLSTSRRVELHPGFSKEALRNHSGSGQCLPQMCVWNTMYSISWHQRGAASMHLRAPKRLLNHTGSGRHWPPMYLKHNAFHGLAPARSCIPPGTAESRWFKAVLAAVVCKTICFPLPGATAELHADVSKEGLLNHASPGQCWLPMFVKQ